MHTVTSLSPVAGLYCQSLGNGSINDFQRQRTRDAAMNTRCDNGEWLEAVFDMRPVSRLYSGNQQPVDGSSSGNGTVVA
jgi:hypothetical protein